MKKFLIVFLFLGLGVSAVTAQTRTRKPAKQPAKPAVEKVVLNSPQKKNEREETPVVNAPPEQQTTDTKTPQKKNRPEKPTAGAPVKTETPKYNYYYEFTQRDFLVQNIVIEHDENGRGKISFLKKDFDEPVSDPVQLSPASLEKVKSLFQTLNFVDSNETYQSPERNYAHLGTMKIRRKENGKERLAEFNWTENLNARALADEYRKISYQYVWQFDISVARENQPLEAPGLMDTLDGYLRRKEISDPPQMIPLLKDLSNDERIPLMARNRATKIIKQIEKESK